MSSTATVVPEMAWGWPVKHKDNHIDVKELENMRHEVDDSGDDFLDAIIKLYPACDSCAASHFSVVIESELNKYKRGTQTGLVDGSTRQAQPALPLADQKKVVQILANAGTFKAEQVAFLERLIDLKNATMSKLFIAYERDRDANALIQGLNALPEGHATDYSTEFKTITSQQKNQTSQAQAATKPVLTAEEHVSCFMKQVTEDPPWLDRKLLREGQLFFLRYSTSASIGMLYFSLLGGFSAPKIIKVLDETGYLTKQDRDVTWRRLNETLEMVVDCAASDDALEVGERGWLSVLKVRMLHSRVRRRIENNYYSEEDWDEETFGKPINQEDMMGTLLSFSANILETIDRVGGAYWMTEHQKFAFLHFWRYIGFLIGVSDNYNPLTSVERANGAVESIVLHLLHPSERSGLVARHVISAVSNRPPLTFWGHDMHAEIARGLLGEELTDALGVRAKEDPLGLIAMKVCVVFFLLKLLNMVLPLLIHRDSPRGLAWVKHVREMQRLNVDTALYGNRNRGAKIEKQGGDDATAPKDGSWAVQHDKLIAQGGSCPFGFTSTKSTKKDD